MGRAALLVGAAVLLLAASDPDPKTEATHVVKDGETLGGIANRAEVPRVLIIEANGLKAPYALRTGQKLVIPRRRSHIVQDAETGFGIAMDEGVPWTAIASASGIDPKAPVKTGQKLVIPTVAKPAAPATSASPAPDASPSSSASPSPTASDTALKDSAAPTLRWPVEGKIRRGFVAHKGDNTDWHDGIDVLVPKGQAVRSAAAGKVIFAGDGPKEYGLTVIVYHTGRWTTTYSYLDQITVKDGDEVKAEERVGISGQTGLASEPQLHFELRNNRVAVDPVKYLPKAAKPAPAKAVPAKPEPAKPAPAKPAAKAKPKPA